MKAIQMLPQDNTSTDPTPNQLAALRQVTTAEPAPTIKIRIMTTNGSTVMLQNQQTKLWDIYGKVVANRNSWLDCHPLVTEAYQSVQI